MYRLTQSPQTFVPISENPLPLAHRYGVSQFAFFYLLLGYFTCTSFSVQNPIYPVFKVHCTYYLVFVFQYTVILSYFQALAK